MIEEKIRLLRKQHGKKAQRRKCDEESNAPKRKKTEEEGYKNKWMTSKDRKDEDEDKRKMDDRAKDDQPATKVRRKTQMVMDMYISPG